MELYMSQSVGTLHYCFEMYNNRHLTTFVSIDHHFHKELLKIQNHLNQNWNC